MSTKPRLSVGDYLVAAIFAVTILVVCAQVISRYVLDSSLTWTEEVSRYLFTWMIFLGAALAVREGTHISVDFLVDRLPAAVARWVRVGHLLVVMGFFALVLGLGCYLVYRTKGTHSPALGLPVNWVFYAALPAASLFGIYYALRRLPSVWRGDQPPAESQQETE